MNNILIIRLVTGEDVVASVTATDTGVVLNKPAGIAIQQSPAGRASVGLVDYLMLSDVKEIYISAEHILFTYAPSQDIYNSYNANFGSGIVIAQQSQGNVLPFQK